LLNSLGTKITANLDIYIGRSRVAIPMTSAGFNKKFCQLKIKELLACIACSGTNLDFSGSILLVVNVWLGLEY
jgi:hypothetical protein